MTILAGGTVYTGPHEEPIVDGVVVVEDGVISAAGSRNAVRIPQTDETLDCSGCTVLAGFWNSHVHFFERKWANAAAIPASELQRQLHETFTRFGFTTVFDTGSQWQNTRAIRERIESGEIDGPRIFSTGEALVPPGAMPAAPVLAALGYVHFPTPEISDAAQAESAAVALLAAGTDGIKIFPSSPRSGAMPPQAVSAAAHAALAAGKPAFAHPDTAADVLVAIRGGVNVVAHTTPRSGPWDDALIDEMRRREVTLTPTLAVWDALMRHDRISIREQFTQTAVAQLRAWHSAGGTILFGTDLGATDPDPAAEYALMSQAGMGFTDILASLTIAPAKHFGVHSPCGRIAEGYQADLTVVGGDPARNVADLANVRYVLRAGKIMRRSWER